MSGWRRHSAPSTFRCDAALREAVHVYLVKEYQHDSQSSWGMHVCRGKPPCLWEQLLPTFHFVFVGYNPLFTFSRWMTRIEQGHINEQFPETPTTQEDQKKGRKVHTPSMQTRNNQTLLCLRKGYSSVPSMVNSSDWSHFKSVRAWAMLNGKEEQGEEIRYLAKNQSLSFWSISHLTPKYWI